MSITSPAKATSSYSSLALETFQLLERKVDAVFNDVRGWRGWKRFTDAETPDSELIGIVREIFRAVAWYQGHTTEAGFHMLGRLPKAESRLIQQLCSHKAEEAEHGEWAKEDYERLGGRSLKNDREPASPASFAVAAVWWRMAQAEDPMGYLGAEYLFEQLTALVTQAAVPVISARGLPTLGFRFIVEHATEDVKHATFIKHLILDTVTRHPASAPAMLRCFDYFHHVYPLPLWDEAYLRAASPKGH